MGKTYSAGWPHCRPHIGPDYEDANLDNGYGLEGPGMGIKATIFALAVVSASWLLVGAAIHYGGQ